MTRLVRELKKPETYIKNVASVDKFGHSNITVEHRHNNAKRDYLFVNKKQCKHIPCSPHDMIKMCRTMANHISTEVSIDEKILIVAFAETATAIGNLVADMLTQCSYVVQTTREEVENSEQLITFEEEHSHATTQRLLTYNDDRAINLNDFTYILFIDDEISTGNTILNFIDAFEKVMTERAISEIKYGVASICNWQNDENSRKFIERDIDTFYLISGDLVDTNVKIVNDNDIIDEDAVKQCDKGSGGNNINVVSISRTMFEEERLGHEPWRNKLDNLIERLSSYVDSDTKSIRVIGTEEFMYLPIKLGYYLEKIKKLDVLCHATTRSCIDILKDVSCGTADGIKSRNENIPSLYDCNRPTNLYNLDEYTDEVFILTDSVTVTNGVFAAYYEMLKDCTGKVTLIRL